MADVAVILTIVAFFAGAVLLARALDRLIAEADSSVGEAGDTGETDLDREGPHAELRSGRSA